MSEKERKIKSKPVRIIIAVFLVIFIFAIVFVVAQTLMGVPFSNVTKGITDFFDSLSSGPGYPYEKETANIESVKVLDNKIIVLTNDRTYLLSKSAKESGELQHTYSDPTLVVKDGNFVVYDRASGRIRYNNSSGIIWEKDFEKNILSADISENSRVIVATRESSTKCVMTVLSKKQEVLFQWNCSSGYIGDVAISDNGKYFSAVVISQKNAEILSTLYIFSIDEKEAIYKTEYADTTVFNVSFTDDDSVVAIGDKVRSVITLKGERTDDEVFKNNTLASVAYDPSGTSVLQLLEYSGVNSNILVMTDEDGKECARVKIPSSVKKVACGEEYFAAVLSDKIMCYNDEGENVGQISVNNEVENIVIIGSDCYVFTSGVINKYSVKNQTD